MKVNLPGTKGPEVLPQPNGRTFVAADAVPPDEVLPGAPLPPANPQGLGYQSLQPASLREIPGAFIRAIALGVAIGTSIVGAAAIPLVCALSSSNHARPHARPQEQAPAQLNASANPPVAAATPAQAPPPPAQPASPAAAPVHQPPVIRIEIHDHRAIPPPQAPAKPAQQAKPEFELLPVEALDGTFTVKLPRGWKVKSATWRDFRAESPRGESIFCVTSSVSGNQQTHALVLRGLMLMRQNGSISQKEFKQKSRMVSPPLSPEDVLKVFIPAVRQDIKQMKILHRGDPDGIVFEGMGMGMQTKKFHYSFVDRGIGPEIREGISEVSTSNPPQIGAFKFWGITIFGFEVPQTLVQDAANRRLYLQILQSYSLKPDVVRQRVQEETARVQGIATNYQRIANSIQESHNKFMKAMDEARQTRQRSFEKMMDALAAPSIR